MPTISGKWKFNDVLSDLPIGNYPVNFTSVKSWFGSNEYDEFRVYKSGTDLYLGYMHTKSNQLHIAYDFTKNSWFDEYENFSVYIEELKKIDFGTSPQEVTQEFYDWFTANAKKLSAIIIPSKNIYQKENDKVANNNSITSVEQTTNNISLEYGNVLSRSLNFNFYDFSDDEPKALYNDNKNTEGFDFYTTSNGTDGVIEVSARLRLKIEKNTIFETLVENGSILLRNHKVKSKRIYYYKIKNNTSGNEYHYESREKNRIEFYQPIISYDKKTNTLEMDIKRTIKDVGDWFESSFLASETFELVGDYIVSDQSSIKFGSGEKVFSLSPNELSQSNSIISNLQGVGTVTQRLSGNEGTGLEELEILTELELTKGSVLTYQDSVAIVEGLVREDGVGKYYKISTSWGGLFYQSMGTKINFFISNEVTFSSYLAEYILGKYKNGKETAKIRCGIADYFDEHGNKVIGTSSEDEKMSLEIGDEVVPYVRSEFGKDLPLSLGLNGTAKTFKVTAVEFIYDGAVWQELTLSEYGVVESYTKYTQEANDANGYTYKINSNQISTSENQSNGTTYIIGVNNGC